jgi:hypothetical protein
LIGTSRLHVSGNDDDDNDKVDDVMSMGELQDEAERKSKIKNMRPRGNNVEIAFSTISIRFGWLSWVKAQELFDSLPNSITRTGDNRCSCCCNDWMGNHVWQDRAPEECNQRHE